MAVKTEKSAYELLDSKIRRIIKKPDLKIETSLNPVNFSSSHYCKCKEGKRFLLIDLYFTINNKVLLAGYVKLEDLIGITKSSYHIKTDELNLKSKLIKESTEITITPTLKHDFNKCSICGHVGHEYIEVILKNEKTIKIYVAPQEVVK